MKFDPESMESRAVHELLVGCVTPRPIALVSTIGENGIYNVAPFSFFTLMALHPALATDGTSINTPSVMFRHNMFR